MKTSFMTAAMFCVAMVLMAPAQAATEGSHTRGLQLNGSNGLGPLTVLESSEVIEGFFSSTVAPESDPGAMDVSQTSNVFIHPASAQVLARGDATFKRSVSIDDIPVSEVKSFLHLTISLDQALDFELVGQLSAEGAATAKSAFTILRTDVPGSVVRLESTPSSPAAPFSLKGTLDPGVYDIDLFALAGESDDFARSSYDIRLDILPTPIPLPAAMYPAGAVLAGLIYARRRATQQ